MMTSLSVPPPYCPCATHSEAVNTDGMDKVAAEHKEGKRSDRHLSSVHGATLSILLDLVFIE